MATQELDPITLQVISGALDTIAEETKDLNFAPIFQRAKLHEITSQISLPIFMLSITWTMVMHSRTERLN